MNTGHVIKQAISMNNKEMCQKNRESNGICKASIVVQSLIQQLKSTLLFKNFQNPYFFTLSKIIQDLVLFILHRLEQGCLLNAAD